MQSSTSWCVGTLSRSTESRSVRKCASTTMASLRWGQALVRTLERASSARPGLCEHLSACPGLCEHLSARPGLCEYLSARPGLCEYLSARPGLHPARSPLVCFCGTGWLCGWTGDGRLQEWMDRWMDGWMDDGQGVDDERTDGCMDGWIDR
eukprot:365223-Chlamydomonas_euryale.AAC.1